jgi:hypothetical protein
MSDEATGTIQHTRLERMDNVSADERKQKFL